MPETEPPGSRSARVAQLADPAQDKVPDVLTFMSRCHVTGRAQEFARAPW